MNGRVIQAVRENADLFYEGHKSSAEAYAAIDQVANSAWNWYDGILNDTRVAFDKRVEQRISDDVDSWATDTYLTRELEAQRERGTHPDEDFFRMQVTGDGSTRWLNITPAQLDAVIETLR